MRRSGRKHEVIRFIFLLALLELILPCAYARRSSVPARHAGASGDLQVCRPHALPSQAQSHFAKRAINPTMSSGTLDLRAAFGENNITQGTTSPGEVLVQGVIPRENGINMAVDISNNYWGGRDPNDADQEVLYWPNFNYLPNATVLSNPTNISNIQVSCIGDSSGGIVSGKGAKPLSTLEDTTLDSCTGAEIMAQRYSGKQQWQLAYDTIRYYFQHCYLLPGYDGIWEDILKISNSVC